MVNRVHETDYAQAIGVLREMEKTLLSREQWQRAIDAPDFNEALRVMGGDYDFTLQSDMYEPALQAKLKETYDRLYELSVEPEIVDILNLKYVFHNLKVWVKASVSEHARQNSDAILSEAASVTQEVLRAGVKEGCPEYVSEALVEMEAAYAAAHDPQAIDMCADRLMYARMLALAEQVGNEYILRYVQMSIDLYNLKLLVRVKNMQKGPRFLQDALLPGGLTDTALMYESYDKPFDLIAAKCYFKYFGDAVRQAGDDYDKTGNFSTLEKLADNLLTAQAAQAKYIAFGPEPLFAYILARENEIRQIRIVLTCKLNKIAEDILRERLRDVNV